MVKMEELAKHVLNCKHCPLWKTRTNPVIGEGNVNADIMFVGEAPGRREDQLGRPFVGRAGKLLSEMLHSVGMTRNEVYISNVVKCKPPNNRSPKAREIKACLPYLNRQIKAISPSVICTLGLTATQYILTMFGLLGGNISELHGKVLSAPSVRVVPLYHPSVVIRNIKPKSTLFEGFKTVKKLYLR